MKFPKLLSSLAAAALYCATSLLASAFTVTTEQLVNSVDDRVGSTNGSVLTDPIFPGSQSMTAIDGANTATTTIDRAVTGDQATLSYSFAHVRNGTAVGFAQSYGTIEFTVAANATYSATGFYSVDDSGTTSGDVFFLSALLDATTNTHAYRSFQNSRSTNDETLTMGMLGGDLSNSFQGSLTGNLVAGHTYRLSYSLDIQAYPDADNGATATGNVTLKINGGAPVASVPDAGSSAGLLALGLAALAAARRKLTVA